MNESKNDFGASKKNDALPYFSLVCGAVAWAVILLNFTAFFGSSFGTIFWFIPPAFVGFVTGVVSYFRGGNKRMALIAICVNSLTMIVLLLMIGLLKHSGGFRE